MSNCAVEDHASQVITAVRRAITESDDLIVAADLECGCDVLVYEAPFWHVHLMARNFVGKTWSGACSQADCWLDAAERGVPRIMDVQYNYIHPFNPEVVAFMSDGTEPVAFRFNEKKCSIEKEALFDLSLEQARTLKKHRVLLGKIERGLVDRDDVCGILKRQLEMIEGCLNCGRIH